MAGVVRVAGCTAAIIGKFEWFYCRVIRDRGDDRGFLQNTTRNTPPGLMLWREWRVRAYNLPAELS